MANKTTTVTFRMNPSVKEVLRAAAEKERRSVANMIEVMVLEYTKNMGETGRVVAGHDPGKKIPVSGKTRKAP